MEGMDRERVTITSVVGMRSHTAHEWLKLTHNVYGGTLQEAIQNQPCYSGINAPPTLQHRYIAEDVPMSLVPIASL